jgi:hypothetical protein
MAICNECLDHFIPDHYLELCNSCGGQMVERYESMQEFKSPVLTIAELVSRVVWGEQEPVERYWRIG